MSSNSDDDETARYLASYLSNYYGGTLDEEKLYELIKDFYASLC